MPSKKFSTSVVIPNYNGQKLLEKHLPAVIKNSEGAEIIVVDDASSDDSLEYLKKEFPQIKRVALKKNQRFAAACNEGVKKTTGDIIVLLNNDVSPQKEYLKPLLQEFEDSWVFAVGCKELDENGKEFGRAGMSFKQGFIVHHRCKDQDKEHTAWAAGGSAAFRKDMWQELGGMDTLFKPAYEEDRDLSYRALKRGWKVKFAPESIVYHQHESTNASALGRTKMKTASYKNHLLFIWKNIHQTSFLLQHAMWLPYHLLITTIRSRGLFAVGFFWALFQIPQLTKKRKEELFASTRKDGDVLQETSC